MLWLLLYLVAMVCSFGLGWVVRGGRKQHGPNVIDLTGARRRERRP